MGIQIEFVPIFGDTMCLALPDNELYPMLVFQVTYKAVPGALVINEQQVLWTHVALHVVLYTRREAGELLISRSWFIMV